MKVTFTLDVKPATEEEIIKMINEKEGTKWII